MYQISSESQEFYRRYYEKQFDLIFPDTLVTTSEKQRRMRNVGK